MFFKWWVNYLVVAKERAAVWRANKGKALLEILAEEARRALADVLNKGRDIYINKQTKSYGEKEKEKQ